MWIVGKNVDLKRHKNVTQSVLLHQYNNPSKGRVNAQSGHTVYPKKYAHGFCFVVLCCGYTLTDFPISIRLTSLALWQSNDCPSASKATLMNMDKCSMWIHYERLHNHNKPKHNKTVCIFLGIYCMLNTGKILGHSDLNSWSMQSLTWIAHFDWPRKYFIHKLRKTNGENMD